MGTTEFRRRRLRIGDDEIPVLIGSRSGRPSAVFMSYEAFCDVVATLEAAMEMVVERGGGDEDG